MTITEILLKVELNTIKQTNKPSSGKIRCQRIGKPNNLSVFGEQVNQNNQHGLWLSMP
jgi:hypothetical protein